MPQSTILTYNICILTSSHSPIVTVSTKKPVFKTVSLLIAYQNSITLGLLHASLTRNLLNTTPEFPDIMNMLKNTLRWFYWMLRLFFNRRLILWGNRLFLSEPSSCSTFCEVIIYRLSKMTEQTSTGYNFFIDKSLKATAKRTSFESVHFLSLMNKELTAKWISKSDFL